ncbi:MAG: ABC transporter ATP-binding protein [Desulfovibrio sp.]|jgi:sulfate transport system ATP-binding protein|nr:ABC transporter ATP-binding protein [Desulfovibrio sp.]
MYVELRHIHKSFDAVRAARDVSFGVDKGALAALLGPSGSGKTTILRMIAGLQNPDYGDILIDGLRVNDMPPSRRGIGFVFQNYALFRYMTVFDNIAFGLEVRKIPRAAVRDRVSELLALIGLEGFERRYPAQLSGGQKQRVAFARALAPNPSLLLLDEPFAAVDAKVRRELRLWLREMVGRLGVTSIFVTHDQDEAVEAADTIIVTNQGVVEQLGRPAELYKDPATPFVAGFIGDSTPLDDVTALKGFEGEAAPGAVRPEFIRILPPGEVGQYPNCLEEAVVEGILFRGAWLEVRLAVGGISLPARYPLEDPPLTVGDAVRVMIYRLYAFVGERVILRQNAGLRGMNSDYAYSI